MKTYNFFVGNVNVQKYDTYPPESILFHGSHNNNNNKNFLGILILQIVQQPIQNNTIRSFLSDYVKKSRVESVAPLLKLPIQSHLLKADLQDICIQM